MANHLRFAKLKPSKLVVTIDSLLADLFIHQTFLHQMLENSKFAKHSPRQTFPLYGMILFQVTSTELINVEFIKPKRIAKS